ncbi:MAG: ABC transporter permease [Sedimentisphaerales bacterium]|nr:ABC transporter permease [Sedimentisphaerales bacterium]
MFKLLLIWRYFLKKRIAYIAIVSVMLLVAVVIVVLTVMSGLLNEARRHNHNWSGDIVISRASLVGFPFYDEFIRELLTLQDTVQAATPVIKTFGLLDSRNVTYNSLQLFGLRLAEFCRVTSFARTLHYQQDSPNPRFYVPDLAGPRINRETLTQQQKRRGCIYGVHSQDREAIEWARWRNENTLYVLKTQTVTVFAIDSKGTLTGSEIGDTLQFWYVDDAKTRLVDLDGSAMFVDFDVLQELCWMAGQDGRPPRTSEIRIKLKPDTPLQAARTHIENLWQQFTDRRENIHQNLMNDVTVQTWEQYRRANIAPLEKEKNLMIVVFSMIALVAIFIIFAIFYMIVTEKIKDLGILKSLGSSRWSLAQVFLGYGLLVGLVGAGLGMILGCVFVFYINSIEDFLYNLVGFRLWPPEIYPIDRIPNTVDFNLVTAIAAAAVLACLTGAIIPARRAARLNVIEALRVE